jgi:hypothetical protein
LEWHVNQGSKLIAGRRRAVLGQPACLPPSRHRPHHPPPPHTRPPPSLFRYHPCLSLFSFFPPSFLIFESLQLSPSPQIKICDRTPPLSIPLPCCYSMLLVALKINSSILHFLFSLVLHPWLLLVCGFFFSCIDLNICLTCVCCFNSIICY